MLFCTNCGTPTGGEGKKFCTKCGAVLPEDPATDETQTAVTTPPDIPPDHRRPPGSTGDRHGGTVRGTAGSRRA